MQHSYVHLFMYHSWLLLQSVCKIYLASKAQNIYYLAPYRKGLLTQVCGRHSRLNDSWRYQIPQVTGIHV